jgi:predicted PolB exonuclease-like 3'-5' exonuclease
MNERFLLFDCETVPDLKAARRMLGIAAALDGEVRQRLGEHYVKDGQAPEDAFIKSALHRIVALSVLQVDSSPLGIGYRITWLSTRHLGTHREADIVQPFVSTLLESRPITPILVGFNTSGFDLPLIRYRALALGISAPALHKRAGNMRDYFYRFGRDHIDLCERLSNFGATSRPSLAELCAICGIRVKIGGMDGSQVEKLAVLQRWHEIGEYCETDVMALYLLFLRYQLVVGEMTPEAFAASMVGVNGFIRENSCERPHLAPFMAPTSAALVQEMAATEAPLTPRGLANIS